MRMEWRLTVRVGVYFIVALNEGSNGAYSTTLENRSVSVGADLCPIELVGDAE